MSEEPESGNSERLSSAAESLRDAESLVDDSGLGDRLYAEAESLADLADSDADPDERRLSGHEHTIQEFESAASEDARDDIARALDHVTSKKDAVGRGSN